MNKQMKKYRVTIKYGDPGKSKLSTRTITVEAPDSSSAMVLAVNSFKNSSSSYKNKEVDVIKLEII